MSCCLADGFCGVSAIHPSDSKAAHESDSPKKNRRKTSTPRWHRMRTSIEESRRGVHQLNRNFNGRLQMSGWQDSASTTNGDASASMLRVMALLAARSKTGACRHKIGNQQKRGCPNQRIDRTSHRFRHTTVCGMKSRGKPMRDSGKPRQPQDRRGLSE